MIKNTKTKTKTKMNKENVNSNSTINHMVIQKSKQKQDTFKSLNNNLQITNTAQLISKKFFPLNQLSKNLTDYLFTFLTLPESCQALKINKRIAEVILKSELLILYKHLISYSSTSNLNFTLLTQKSENTCDEKDIENYNNFLNENGFTTKFQKTQQEYFMIEYYNFLLNSTNSCIKLNFNNNLIACKEILNSPHCRVNSLKINLEKQVEDQTLKELSKILHKNSTIIKLNLFLFCLTDTFLEEYFASLNNLKLLEEISFYATDEDFSISSDSVTFLINDFCEALKVNTSVKRLRIGYTSFENRETELVNKKIEGLLKKNKNFQQISLDFVDDDFDFEFLNLNKNLTTLEILCSITKDSLENLSSHLAKNNSLKILKFDSIEFPFDFDDSSGSGSSYMGSFLCSSNFHLSQSESQVSNSSGGYYVHNDPCFYDDSEDTKDFLLHIGNILEKNKSIETLIIEENFCKIKRKGLEIFNRSLKNNFSLKNLKIINGVFKIEDGKMIINEGIRFNTGLESVEISLRKGEVILTGEEIKFFNEKRGNLKSLKVSGVEVMK